MTPGPHPGGNYAHSAVAVAPLPLCRALQPAAAPNAGFMQQLAALDEQLHGSCSLEGVPMMRRGKPQPRTCPVCHQDVGVSAASLALHMRSRHGSEPGSMQQDQQP